MLCLSCPRVAQRAFMPYGEIEDAAVATDKDTGKSRGFGFIVYKYLEGAQVR